LNSSPEGTAERNTVIAVFQPSLRDFIWGDIHSSVEYLFIGSGCCAATTPPRAAAERLARTAPFAGSLCAAGRGATRRSATSSTTVSRYSVETLGYFHLSLRDIHSEFPKGIAANLTSCPRLADEPAQTEERRQYPAGCRSAAAGVPDAAVVYLD